MAGAGGAADGRGGTGAAVMLAPPAAFAEGDPNWQTCIGAAVVAGDRVTACSAVIDAKVGKSSRG